MAIVPITELLEEARLGGYAVCYCESWNLESLQAVVEAAEECDSPVIAGFNGGFLRSARRGRPERLAYYAGFRLALEQSPARIGFLLNESDDPAQIEEAIALGFNGVMLEPPEAAPSDYQREVASVVQAAHRRNVWVEAQLGTLPDGQGGGHSRGQVTDPEAARRFVAATGVDALSVSIGNVHILTRGTSPVDFDALRRIRDAVGAPLVLHGGTGIPPDAVPRLCRLGIAKLNFGTVLKQAYLEAVHQQLSVYRPPENPHPYLGMGGPEDIMTAGKRAVREKVRQLLRLCGSCGPQKPGPSSINSS